MYQFDFIRDGEYGENVISVKATSYSEAVKKIRKIGLPDFELQAYFLEGVYETGTIISERTN